MMRQKDIDRFWGHVDIGEAEDCWNWKLCCYWDNYGQTKIEKKFYKTHRVAYELAYPIPSNFDDLVVCHHCDNPKCCNPSHLFLGTNLDNSKDRQAKGRKGKVNPGKLKDHVEEIRQLRAEGWSFNKLAKKFKCTRPAISRIFRPADHPLVTYSTSKKADPPAVNVPLVEDNPIHK